MSYVYVAESGCGYCKIGASKNPQLRLQAIQSQTGLKITNFKYFKCSGDMFLTELECHKVFTQRLFGEWFRVNFFEACLFVSKKASIKYMRDCDQVKINFSVRESLKDDLKEIAKKKGMKFHPYIAKELEKIRNREIKK